MMTYFNLMFLGSDVCEEGLASTTVSRQGNQLFNSLFFFYQFNHFYCF